MKDLFILLWAVVASVDALASHLPRETHNPPVHMHRRGAASPPYPTNPPTAQAANCNALAALFPDIYHDNAHFCTIYERGFTITITADCKGCNLDTMTMPRKHCWNTANVTFRIPSTTIECAPSIPTPTPTSTPAEAAAAASDRIYPAGYKGPAMSAAI